MGMEQTPIPFCPERKVGGPDREGCANLTEKNRDSLQASSRLRLLRGPADADAGRPHLGLQPGLAAGLRPPQSRREGMVESQLPQSQGLPSASRRRQRAGHPPHTARRHD